jgi:hypothetical protein
MATFVSRYLFLLLPICLVKILSLPSLLTDEALEDPENLQPPETIAKDLTENLQSTLDQFNNLTEDLRHTKIIAEAQKLVEQDFEFVCQTDGATLFRKRKQPQTWSKH